MEKQIKKPSDRIIEIATEMWNKLPIEKRDGYLSVGKYGQTIVKRGTPIEIFLPEATIRYLDEVELTRKKTK